MPSIFISFSTADGGDIADHVYNYYKRKGYSAFLSSEEIPYGHQWRDEIKKRVKECDILLVIATYGAIESQEVAKEIDEAKRLGKRIIPCRPNDINWSDLEKLGVDLAQGPEFDSKYDLIRKLEAQLRREFAGTSVQAPQNYTRQQKTGLLASSKHEPPSLQPEYIDKKKDDSSQHVQRPAPIYDSGKFWIAKGDDSISGNENVLKEADKVLITNPNDITALIAKGTAVFNLAKQDADPISKMTKYRGAEGYLKKAQWILSIETQKDMASAKARPTLPRNQATPPGNMEKLKLVTSTLISLYEDMTKITRSDR